MSRQDRLDLGREITEEIGIPSFGEAIRALREEGYPNRLQLEAKGPSPHVRFSGLELISTLRRMQPPYPLSSGALSEIERNNNFPRTPREFIIAFAKALDFNTGEFLWLLRCYAVNATTQRLGELIFPHLEGLHTAEDRTRFAEAYKTMLQGKRLPEVEDEYTRGQILALLKTE